MESSLITEVLIPAALAVVMFGLGLGLEVADFTRVARFPRAVFIGLATQTLLLTAVAYAVARLCELPPQLAVGLMLLAAAPGGAAACLYSHLARGDVALNLTLTGINCVLALAWMPLVTAWSLDHFIGRQNYVAPPTDHVFQIALVVILPVVAGMAVRWVAPAFCIRAERTTRILAILVIASLLTVVFAQLGPSVLDYFAMAGAAALVFNVVSLAIGYLVPVLMRLSRPQATAISLEIGMHNAALAAVVAISALHDEMIAVPAVVYGAIMFVTGGIVATWLGRRSPPSAAYQGARGS